MQMTEQEFSRKFDEFAQSKNIPLRDALNQKQSMWAVVQQEADTQEKKEKLYGLYYLVFTQQFGAALPPGTQARAVVEPDDSE